MDTQNKNTYLQNCAEKTEKDLLKKLFEYIKSKELKNEIYSKKKISTAIGKTKNYMSQIELRSIKLSLSSFTDLAHFFGESPKDLFAKIYAETLSPFYIFSFNAKRGFIPKKYDRYGHIENETITFFSLLDSEDESINKLVSEFQISLVEFNPDAETETHYHVGEETAIVLEGEFMFSMLNFEKKDRPQKSMGLYTDVETRKYSSVSFNALIPHRFSCTSPKGIVLSILSDPRGEAGLYARGNNNEETNIGIYKSNKKFGSIINFFGDKLKYYRSKSGLSIKNLSDITGISSSVLSRLEKNEINPPLGKVILIGYALDINPELLLRNTPTINANHKKFKQGDNAKIISNKLSIEIISTKTTKNKMSDKIDTAFFIINGSAEIIVNQEHKILEERDTIYILKGNTYKCTPKPNSLLIKVTKKL